MSRKVLRALALTIATGLFVNQSMAVAPGLYVGAMVGPSRNSASSQYVQANNSTALILATPKSNQVGARGYVGYKINPYAGIESGLNYYSSIQYDTNTNACSSVQSRVTDVDIVGVASYPILNSFNVFGKGGAAFAYIQTSGAFYPTSPPNTCGNNSNVVRVRPTFSLGASYDFSQNWVADISWNRLMTYGITQNIDLYALGITYHFVDKFCGQFLCDD